MLQLILCCTPRLWQGIQWWNEEVPQMFLLDNVALVLALKEVCNMPFWANLLRGRTFLLCTRLNDKVSMYGGFWYKFWSSVKGKMKACFMSIHPRAPQSSLLLGKTRWICFKQSMPHPLPQPLNHWTRLQDYTKWGSCCERLSCHF